jgi:hypothetical protein
MQFEISDGAAITFAHEFYGAFADGYSIEAALAEARKSMFAGQNDSEWATPVLYLRSLDGPIFRISPVMAHTAIGARLATSRASGLLRWKGLGRHKAVAAAGIGGASAAAIVAAVAVFTIRGEASPAPAPAPSPTAVSIESILGGSLFGESSFNPAFWSDFNSQLQNALSTGN